MAYCTVDDVRGNHERLPKVKEEEEIEAFIVDADALINAFLSRKYPVPFDPTPSLVKWISKSFATYFTLTRLVGAQASDRQHETWIEVYWTRPLDILERTANCELDLHTTEGELVTTYNLIRSNTSGKKPIFDLGDTYDSAMHPTSGDKRYGYGYE
jgi:phage gp36-like protein